MVHNQNVKRGAPIFSACEIRIQLPPSPYHRSLSAELPSPTKIRIELPLFHIHSARYFYIYTILSMASQNDFARFKCPFYLSVRSLSRGRTIAAIKTSYQSGVATYGKIPPLVGWGKERQISQVISISDCLRAVVWPRIADREAGQWLARSDLPQRKSEFGIGTRFPVRGRIISAFINNANDLYNCLYLSCVKSCVWVT